jgi:hypothetical protein
MEMGNAFIGNIGAIEHNMHHAELTCFICYDILNTLGYAQREAELGAIAGYLHDIGNLINRYNHGMSGAIMALNILLDLEMDPGEIATIMGAIGNHEENSGGQPVNNVAAALILADKSDVHRSRVRKQDIASFTPRDRVNYAVTSSNLLIDKSEMSVALKMHIDTSVCSVMEYFEIFLTKMLMCRRAAKHLKCEFQLIINDSKLL